MIQHPLKTTTDAAAVGGSLLGFFKMIPWPEIANTNPRKRGPCA